VLFDCGFIATTVRDFEKIEEEKLDCELKQRILGKKY
jgi:hypothetical protein